MAALKTPRLFMTPITPPIIKMKVMMSMESAMPCGTDRRNSWIPWPFCGSDS